MAEFPRFSRRTALKAALGGLAATAAGVLPAATPSQTAGPFFPKKDQADKDLDLTRIAGHDKAAQGEVHVIEGRVLDENGAPVADALVDVWQANRHGRYDHEADPNPAPLDPDFQGWARLRTDAEGVSACARSSQAPTRSKRAGRGRRTSIQSGAPRIPRTHHPDVFRR